MNRIAPAILALMTLLIGIDEAGYGPNLGPLVVAATAWEVENETRKTVVNGKMETEEREGADLYDLLADSVSRRPAKGRIAIADSKRLYKPGSGLGRLERAVHAALAACGQTGESWSALLESLGADPASRRQEVPWQRDFDGPLPIDVATGEVDSLGKRLAASCQVAGVRLIGLRGRIMFPREFNDLTVRHDSKGAALSHTTLNLLQEFLVDVAGKQDFRHRQSTRIVCDKHGGRNRYGPLLAAHFPAETIRTFEEGRTESRYRWGNEDASTEISFRVRGEAFLPTALASMTAKYLRELAMGRFNRFWRMHIPEIRPTAGYPLDAKRFRAEIRVVQQRLEIADRDLWRNR